MDFLSTFGVDPAKFAIQSLLFLIPAIWATIRVSRIRSGTPLALWVVLIWILPFIGPSLALIAVRYPKTQNA